jgi:hypothetical protein
MNVPTLSRQNTQYSMSYSTKIMADTTGVKYARMINKAGTHLSLFAWRKEVLMFLIFLLPVGRLHRSNGGCQCRHGPIGH